MSIYPVKLAEWFPKGDSHHDIMKCLVSNGWGEKLGCIHCGKKHMHWQEAWGHHSLPWGYGDLWCREKCYRNYWKKQNKRRQYDKKRRKVS